MSLIPRIKLTWTLDDDTSGEGEAVASDWRALEKHTGQTITELGDRMGVDHLMFLAWRVQHRKTSNPPAFDVWADRVVDVDMPEFAGDVPS